MDTVKRFARGLSAAALYLFMVNSAIADVVTYFHNDISGSPMAASDAAGNLLWKENYKPYGEKLTRSVASTDNKIGFHGKAFDDGTGLSYVGARYYDPVLGRFMGIDPVDYQEDNLHSFNRYAFTNNNPFKFIDADGQYAELAFEAASLAFGVMSFQQNIDAGRYGAATVDGIGVGFDAVMSVLPFAPGVAGLGIKSMRAADPLAGATAKTNAVPSLEKQAADLVPLNNNKSRVTLRSESVKIELDLIGKEHSGVPTPHIKESQRNLQAPANLGRKYNSSESKTSVRAATQQDIRTVRRYLERQ